MRVLSIIETLGLGGAEVVSVDLALGLREHEHRFVHFSAANRVAPHAPFQAALAEAGIPVVDVHWTALRQPASRRELLGGFTPDVVLFHWWGHDPFRSWLGEGGSGGTARPRFVLVLHRAGVAAPPAYDRHVLVTPTQSAQVASVPRERMRIIPNGVDLGRFAALPHPGPGFVVGRLSDLRPEKIPADYVRTAASWDLPGARFVIAGDGVLRESLQADVRSLGAEGRFHLPGCVARENVPALLAGFHVFCHLTSTAVECHPLALLESLAAGVPIVAEAQGGIPDIVEHGVNGLLARTTGEVEGRLRELQGNHDLRERLAAGARASAPRFSLDRQLASYRTLLAELA